MPNLFQYLFTSSPCHKNKVVIKSHFKNLGGCQTRMRAWNDIKAALHISWDEARRPVATANQAHLCQLRVKVVAMGCVAPGSPTSSSMTAPSSLCVPALPLPLSPHTPCMFPQHRLGPSHPLPPPETMAPSPTARFLLRCHLLLRVPPTHPHVKLPTQDSHLGIPYPHLTFYPFYLCLVCLPLLECKGQDGKDFCLF